MKVTNLSGVYHISDTVSVHVTKLDQPSISERNDTLYSNSDSFNQWYLNGQPIAGANGNRLKPEFPGSYSVGLVSNDCTSLISQSYDYGLLIYPNPSQGYLNIVVDPAYGKMQMRVYDITGRLIIWDTFAGKKRIEGIRPGIYFLELKSEKGKVVKRILSR